MEFEWDERKRLANIDKHGFDFIDVWELFAGDNIRAGANPGPDGEQRFLATGFIQGIHATVIGTVRNGVTRVISLRRARTNERRQHQALFGG